jgi:hypothetical protein
MLQVRYLRPGPQQRSPPLKWQQQRRGRGGPAVSTDTATANIETEAVVGEDDDTRSADAPVEQVMETPRKVAEEEGHSKLSADK